MKKALKISLIAVIATIIVLLLLYIMYGLFCPPNASPERSYPTPTKSTISSPSDIDLNIDIDDIDIVKEGCCSTTTSSTTHSPDGSGSTSSSTISSSSDINMEKTYTVNVFDTTNCWFSTGLIIETANKIYLNIDDTRVTKQLMNNRFELKKSNREAYKYMTTEKLEREGVLYVK